MALPLETVHGHQYVEVRHQCANWPIGKIDNPSGKNNGTVGDNKYFECKDKHGIFVRKDALSRATVTLKTAAKAAAAEASLAAHSAECPPEASILVPKYLTADTRGTKAPPAKATRSEELNAK